MNQQISDDRPVFDISLSADVRFRGCTSQDRRFGMKSKVHQHAGVEHMVLESTRATLDYSGHPVGEWRADCLLCSLDKSGL